MNCRKVQCWRDIGGNFTKPSRSHLPLENFKIKMCNTYQILVTLNKVYKNEKYINITWKLF